MTITQLKYCIAVAEYRNFTAAAEHAFVTQPTLSMQIQKLEEELGYSHLRPLQTSHRTHTIRRTSHRSSTKDSARKCRTGEYGQTYKRFL